MHTTYELHINKQPQHKHHFYVPTISKWKTRIIRNPTGTYPTTNKFKFQRLAVVPHKSWKTF